VFNVVQLCVVHLFNTAVKAVPVFSNLMTVCSPVGIYKNFGETTKSGTTFCSEIGVGFSLRNSDIHTHMDGSATLPRKQHYEALFLV
jgi:hypothetical protein